MAFSIADKFELNLTTVATTKKIPVTVLKRLIMKVFGMASDTTFPDKVYFVEEAKAFTQAPNAKGEILEATRTQRLLLNGEESVVIGLRKGEGTDAASVTDFIFKAQPGVYDLSVWLPAA